MTTVDQFLKALAMVESSDNPEAWGDYATETVERDIGDAETGTQVLRRLPRAMGRWQVHPDALWTWCKVLMISPELGETWDHLVARILTNFFEGANPANSPVQLAMRWHLGHWTFDDKPDWDANYAARFEEALNE